MRKTTNDCAPYFPRSVWNEEALTELTEYLRVSADPAYRDFYASLVPELRGNAYMLGVRTPVLRSIGKAIVRSGGAKAFLEICRRQTYEETMLEGIVIGLGAWEYGEFCALTDSYADSINNWALCDSFCAGLKPINSCYDQFFDYIGSWLASSNPWKTRAALVIMLSRYVNAEYIDRVLARCASARPGELLRKDERPRTRDGVYYAKMAQAWLVSVCCAKFPQKTETFLRGEGPCAFSARGRPPLDDWTFNKSIQKIQESRRIARELRDRLSLLKR